MSHPEESKEQLSLQQHSATKPSTSSTLSSSSSSSVPSSSPLLLPPSDVQLRPSYSAMFKPRQVESMMRSYVEEYLREKQYDANESSNWAKDMAAHIKNKLKGQLSNSSQHTHTHRHLHTRTHGNSTSDVDARLHALSCCVCARSELRLPRYKYLVQVTIGENKGAGVRCGARCFWDQTTDKLAQTQYVNVRANAQYREPVPTAVDEQQVMRTGQTDNVLCPSPQYMCCMQDTMFCVVAAFGVYLY